MGSQQAEISRGVSKYLINIKTILFIQSQKQKSHQGWNRVFNDHFLSSVDVHTINNWFPQCEVMNSFINLPPACLRGPHLSPAGGRLKGLRLKSRLLCSQNTCLMTGDANECFLIYQKRLQTNEYIRVYNMCTSIHQANFRIGS